VRLVICFDLAIDQIAQSGLSSLKVIYYSAQLFSSEELIPSRKTKILRTMALRSGNITHMKHITQRINILPERTIRIITTF
ncbi:hypothetical protein CBL21_22070, partial [Shigella flexneri]